MLTQQAIDIIISLILAKEPNAILVIGSKDGPLIHAITNVLSKIELGKLTILEDDISLHPSLVKTTKEYAHLELRKEASAKLSTNDRYDFVIFNGTYTSIAFNDQEAEFFHVLHFLKNNATVIFIGYSKKMPRLDNLPKKLEEMKILKGEYSSTEEFYNGTYQTSPITDSKRIIFCLSAGRSGTAFLTSLLHGAPGIVALHEPEPQYQAHTLRLQNNPQQAMHFIENTKWPWIKMLPGETYIELSHYVAKGFMEPWLEIGMRPDIIMLERDPRRIALSRYALGIDFFNRKEAPLQNMLHPMDNRKLFFPLPDWAQFNNYQLCYWYALETQLRSHYYFYLLTKKYGANAFITSLETLSDEQSEDVFDLYDWLNINLTGADKILLRRRQKRTVNNLAKNKYPQRIEEIKTLELDLLEAPIKKRFALNGINANPALIKRDIND